MMNSRLETNIVGRLGFIRGFHMILSEEHMDDFLAAFRSNFKIRQLMMENGMMEWMVASRETVGMMMIILP